MSLIHWALAMSMALNQLGNALIGGNPDMSVSARAALAREHGSAGGRRACHVLDWLDPHSATPPHEDHCNKALRHYHERLAHSQDDAQ